jgi:hypothetical protein
MFTAWHARGTRAPWAGPERTAGAVKKNSGLAGMIGR